MPLLRSMNSQRREDQRYARGKIDALEEEADQLYMQGLKELYRAHKDSHPMAYIVGAEIYDHLEKVVDGFEDVANRMSGIVIEHI